MKFFFDNNLSSHLADGLRGFGEEVMHLKEKFSGETPDEEWLGYIGENGLFLVTRDNRIRFRPNEWEAFTRHSVGAFFLGGKNRTRCELIQQLVRNWPQIKVLAAKTHRPFAFRVPPSGKSISRIIR